jgi:hypothetical protein
MTTSELLCRIWDSLAKPDGLADAGLQDHFDPASETSSHKVISPQGGVRPNIEFLSRILTTSKFEATVARVRPRGVVRPKTHSGLRCGLLLSLIFDHLLT